MFPILMVVTFQGFLFQMATAQYTIQPIQNQPVFLNRQQLIQTLLTTFNQPTTPQRLELLAEALQQIPPKKNRIYLAELLKQTALQTLKVAASVCNVAEFAEKSNLLQQYTNTGYVLPSEIYNYVPDVLNNYVPRKEVLTNYVPEVFNNFVPRKEVLTNYVPEVLNNYVPRKEVLSNYVPNVLNNIVLGKDILSNYVPEVLNNYVPRKEVVTNFVPEVLNNYVPRKEVLTNFLPKKEVYNGYSNDFFANRAVAPYF